MKKTYETPTAQKIEFRYRDQVVAASGGVICTQQWIGLGDHDTSGCTYTVNQQDSGM